MAERLVLCGGLTTRRADRSRVIELDTQAKKGAEPYRFCRRLRLLRDWSHDEIDEVFS
jgi:hypothetical protein